MLQSKVGKVFEDVQAFAGGDIPVSALLNFSEDPRLDESTPKKQNLPNKLQQVKRPPVFFF